VGRLTAAKRHADLLAATTIVRQTVPDVYTLIAGDGPLREALENEIATVDLASNASLLGLRDDIRQLMLAADGFVLSSAWEGLPMVLLEAAASSLPIVVTDVGGASEAIRDQETGYLTPPGDPPALADAMLRVMALTAEDRRTMGERARLHCIESFDMNRVADQWEALYRAA
jgi:glycosyltransferase involved in cell wall biosynthesis